MDNPVAHIVPANPDAWKNALTIYQRELAAFVDQRGNETSFAKAKMAMMGLAAPDIDGIMQKLLCLWRLDLDEQGLDSRWKWKIIDDLHIIRNASLRKD
ncbi:hypothetical protein [Aquisediminimonas profunda]|uniref:hypothetical protein n=1 Tax=Aquisediminimonas profunda TaxID=1550733 RepID=UPI001C624F21|nr:hypothetical protein [Aquisediminimonas profunda]